MTIKTLSTKKSILKLIVATFIILTVIIESIVLFCCMSLRDTIIKEKQFKTIDTIVSQSTFYDIRNLATEYKELLTVIKNSSDARGLFLVQRTTSNEFYIYVVDNNNQQFLLSSIDSAFSNYLPVKEAILQRPDQKENSLKVASGASVFIVSYKQFLQRDGSTMYVGSVNKAVLLEPLDYVTVFTILIIFSLLCISLYYCIKGIIAKQLIAPLGTLSDSIKMFKKDYENNNLSLLELNNLDLLALNDEVFKPLISDLLDLEESLIKTKSSLAEVTYVSEHDMLTNLRNRAKLMKDICVYQANLDSCGVIFFDINNLKSINDSMGHELGDVLLYRSARSFYSIIDDNCKVYRFGGDEFLALLYNCTRIEIDIKLDTWKTEVEKINNAATDNVLVNCAYGVAWDSGHPEILSLVEEADKEMYAQKRQMKCLVETRFKET